MDTVLVTYNHAKVAHVWHVTEKVFRLLALQGGWGDEKRGFHCNWDGVTGDFDDVYQVAEAHGLSIYR